MSSKAETTRLRDGEQISLIHRLPMIQETPCAGCSRCVAVCPAAPAIEREKRQERLSDRQVLFSRRVVADVLGTILKLPPVKQATARRQVKPPYPEPLIRRFPP